VDTAEVVDGEGAGETTGAADRSDETIVEVEEETVEGTVADSRLDLPSLMEAELASSSLLGV